VTEGLLLTEGNHGVRTCNGSRRGLHLRLLEWCSSVHAQELDLIRERADGLFKLPNH
jgi:hypothetical protein